MNATEVYIAGAVTLLFVAGIGWLIAALRESRRVRELWQRRA
jgi:hypothetical protein